MRELAHGRQPRATGAGRFRISCARITAEAGAVVKIIFLLRSVLLRALGICWPNPGKKGKGLQREDPNARRCAGRTRAARWAGTNPANPFPNRRAPPRSLPGLSPQPCLPDAAGLESPVDVRAMCTAHLLLIPSGAVFIPPRHLRGGCWPPSHTEESPPAGCRESALGPGPPPSNTALETTGA